MVCSAVCGTCPTGRCDLRRTSTTFKTNGATAMKSSAPQTCPCTTEACVWFVFLVMFDYLISYRLSFFIFPFLISPLLTWVVQRLLPILDMAITHILRLDSTADQISSEWQVSFLSSLQQRLGRLFAYHGLRFPQQRGRDRGLYLTLEPIANVSNIFQTCHARPCTRGSILRVRGTAFKCERR